MRYQNANEANQTIFLHPHVSALLYSEHRSFLCRISGNLNLHHIYNRYHLLIKLKVFSCLCFHDHRKTFHLLLNILPIVAMPFPIMQALTCSILAGNFSREGIHITLHLKRYLGIRSNNVHLAAFLCAMHIESQLIVS